MLLFVAAAFASVVYPDVMPRLTNIYNANTRLKTRGLDRRLWLRWVGIPVGTAYARHKVWLS
jgi:hypothetical protein